MLKWVDTALDFVYPPCCLFCQALLPPAEGLSLCRDCRPRFNPAGFFCPRCQQPYEITPSCSCETQSLPLQGLFALAFYEGEWRKVLHNLKFNRRRSVARPLGTFLGSTLKEQGSWPLQAVVPLPLHRLREKQRGYNQTHLIARHTARALGLPLLPLLQKTRSTAPQTGLSRQERQLNVAGAFSCHTRVNKNCKGSAILLLDDVYSTGATLQEAARVLKEQGADVYGGVAAYNPRLY